MPQGLQVWDAAGNMLVDTTTWMSQVLGSFELPADHAAGSTTDAGLATGRPFVVVLPYEGNLGAESTGNPIANQVTVSGTTISWNAAKVGCRVIYGVY